MKQTGIFREIDKLGRIVIPMELRKTLNIKEGDPIEFKLEGGAIVLRAMKPRCQFCDSEFELSDFEGKFICRTCLEKVKSIY